MGGVRDYYSCRIKFTSMSLHLKHHSKCKAVSPPALNNWLGHTAQKKPQAAHVEFHAHSLCSTFLSEDACNHLQNEANAGTAHRKSDSSWRVWCVALPRWQPRNWLFLLVAQVPVILLYQCCDHCWRSVLVHIDHVHTLIQCTYTKNKLYVQPVPHRLYLYTVHIYNSLYYFTYSKWALKKTLNIHKSQQKSTYSLGSLVHLFATVTVSFTVSCVATSGYNVTPSTL